MNYFSSILALSSVFFFIIRCTTTRQTSADTLSELSFSCHIWSPAGSSGGAAAINDFFGHLDEHTLKFMFLTELTSVSVRALVAAAYYLWYEKIKCNTKVMAKHRIICHSQFKFGCMMGSCLERVLCNQVVPVLMQVAVIIVESNSYIYSIKWHITC